MTKAQMKLIVIETLLESLTLARDKLLDRRRRETKRTQDGYEQNWQAVKFALRLGPLRFGDIRKAAGLDNNQLCAILRRHQAELQRADGKWTLTETPQ